MEFILALIGPAAVAVFAKLYFKQEISKRETLAQIAIGIGFGFMVSVLIAMGQLHDNEYVTGQVINKHRDNDSYEESYDCNCRTVTSGSGDSKTTSTVCDTCWKTIYTVDWYLSSTVGRIAINSRESESQQVWIAPNPQAWIDAKIGEACTTARSYQNYILASPDSLFNSSEYGNNEFAVPGYPRMHSIYKMKHALTVDGAIPNSAEWTEQIREHLKIRNANSSPNVLFVFTKSTDRTFKYALERNWTGGKKNDLIVVIGTANYPNANWTEVITLGKTSGNELTAVKIRDIVEDHHLDPQVTVKNVFSMIDKHFDMKPISDFEYLKDEQQMTLWQALAVVFASIIVSIIVSYIFSRNALRSK